MVMTKRWEQIVEEDHQKELNELKQRLAEVHAWAVCAALTGHEDLFQNIERIVEVTAPDYDPVKESKIDVSGSSMQQVYIQDNEEACDCHNDNNDKWVYVKDSCDFDGMGSLYRCRYCGKEVLV